ncbi:Kunitz/Bovine pancreatic trypsin inhibitor domain protein [Cooperia oncophora]
MLASQEPTRLVNVILSTECESFEYLGCDGNSNNFATRQECESYCGVGGCANGGVPLRDSSGSIQTCSERSGGCPSTHECYAVSLGPDTVSHRCCPTKSYICALPPQQGSSLCSGGVYSVTRYYFNIVTKKCSPFAFNGCDGNPNNFASLNQCNNFCTASGSVSFEESRKVQENSNIQVVASMAGRQTCKAGDVVYLNPNSQTPISCNDEIQNNCPKNFQCTFDSLTDSNVCCGATDMGVCPDGEKASLIRFPLTTIHIFFLKATTLQAFLNAVDMTVRECLINEPNSCPTNYLCRFNPTKNRYFCCGSTKRNHCPPGRAPYKDQMSLQAMRCTMNAHVSTCPDGFECQSDVRDALQGYCCSVSDICPNKEEYFLDEASAMPRSCSVGHFVTCPSGFTCMTQVEGANGYCCRGQTHLGVSDGCPPGEIVYMDKNEVRAI